MSKIKIVIMEGQGGKYIPAVFSTEPVDVLVEIPEVCRWTATTIKTQGQEHNCYQTLVKVDKDKVEDMHAAFDKVHPPVQPLSTSEPKPGSGNGKTAEKKEQDY